VDAGTERHDDTGRAYDRLAPRIGGRESRESVAQPGNLVGLGGQPEHWLTEAITDQVRVHGPSV
jgi:hypothetical protein